MKAEIHVTLKTEVLDPQGDAVRRALSALDIHGVGEVRVGKLIEVQLDADSEEVAREQVVKMCEGLLANPVIEDYAFTLHES
jgi:phosphoribosylformylglycinamidine synthase PurS subunit